MPTCPSCNGTGRYVELGGVSNPVRCPKCYGTGRVSHLTKTCTHCGGTGREKGIASGLFNTMGARCYFCSGSGEIELD